MALTVPYSFTNGMGGRTAQHVEAHPGGEPLGPRRQSAPVPSLFALSGAATQGPSCRAGNPRPWSGPQPSQSLTRVCDWQGLLIGGSRPDPPDAVEIEALGGAGRDRATEPDRFAIAGSNSEMQGKGHPTAGPRARPTSLRSAAGDRGVASRSGPAAGRRRRGSALRVPGAPGPRCAAAG